MNSCSIITTILTYYQIVFFGFSTTSPLPCDETLYFINDDKIKKQQFYSRYSVDDSIFILMFICEERQGWLVRNRGTEFPRTGQASLALTSKLGTFTALSLVSGYDDVGHNVEDCKQEETDLKQQEKKESGLSCDQDSHDQTWAHTVCPTSPSPNVRFFIENLFFRNVTFRLSVPEP